MSGERPGEYRYVRGRTVDPDTGQPSGDEEIPVAEIVRVKLEAVAAQTGVQRRQARWGSRRGRPLGPVQELEDSRWAQSSPPRQRGLPQKLVWVGSGALAAIVTIVVLGAQGPEHAATASDVTPREQAAARTTAKSAGVEHAAVAPAAVEDSAKIRESASPPFAQADVREQASGAEDAPASAKEPSQAVAAEQDGASGVAQPPSGSESPPAEPVVPPVAVPTVKIAINATPWALIEIDGEQVGETPLAGVELAVGRHRFVAHMPDGSVRERVTHVDAGSGAVLFE